MQETYSAGKVKNIWTDQWGCGKGSVYFSRGSSDSRGTLIAFREGMDYTIEKSVLDQEGRYVILQAKIQDSSILLINYYAPSVEGTQITVLSEINDIINNLVLEEDTTILWGSGFNSFFDVKLDADGGSLQLKEKSICKLVTMMSQFDLCDIFRVRHPNEKRFTWRQKNPLKQRRLDHFLISDNLQDLVEYVNIILSVQSNHSALKLKLSLLNERERSVTLEIQ